MGKKENVNRILGLLQKMLHSHHVHRHNIQPWLKLELTKEAASGNFPALL